MADCHDCNGTGYLPFTDKQGDVVPNVRRDCGCIGPEDKYVPVKVEYFDFPMSDAFRAASFEYCTTQDPGYIPSPGAFEEIQRRFAVIESELAASGQDPLQFQQAMQHISARLNYLQNKITEQALQKHKNKGQY